MTRLAAPGTAIEQALAYLGATLWFAAAIEGAKRGMEGSPVVDWGLSATGAILGAASLVEVWDWWRRVPARTVTSGKRRWTTKRALPVTAWFAAGGIVPALLMRRIFPGASWVAVVVGCVVGLVVEAWLVRRSDRRDGWVVLRHAGIGPVDDQGDLRFFHDPPGGLEAQRSFNVITTDVGFNRAQLHAFGLPRGAATGCLVVVDPESEVDWEVAVIAAISDALTAQGLSTVVHKRWIRGGPSRAWSLELVASGAELEARLREEEVLIVDGVDVLIWSRGSDTGEVFAWRLAPGPLLSRVDPDADEDAPSAFAFFALGDRKDSVLQEMQQAARSVDA